ncbi:hypothetical protein F4778DRAFT_795507 [Xylariomycetidae sp. FL2044]|nr:hypothetical protein F4778DRAFT_795507 [Xylariomycetidae sp. FL2044]
MARFNRSPFKPSEYEIEHLEGVKNGRACPRKVHRQAFAYDGRLTYHGIEDVSPHELAIWKAEYKQKVTLTWLTAQLKFYGYDFLHNSSKDRMLKYITGVLSDPNAILDPTGYQEKAFYSLPAIEVEGMKQFWNEQCESYKKRLLAHPNRAAFDQLPSLKDKLELDPELFMDVYFLDRNTTPQTLAFADIDFEPIQAAAQRVQYLHAKVVGRGKNKTIRIGWNPYDVLYGADVNTGGNSRMTAAAKREADKMRNQLRRLEPHRAFLEREESRDKTYEHDPSPAGSYHMEFTGTGWKDDLYKPNNMWIDIRPSHITEGIYEAMFDFGPVLKGMMILSADKEMLLVHSRIMDTVGYVHEDVNPYHDEEEPQRGTREAFLDGFMYAMKRKPSIAEHEEAFARHNRPRLYRSRRGTEEEIPKKYAMIVRGSHRVPEWAGDMLDTNSEESRGYITFADDGLFRSFKLQLGWHSFKGLPAFDGTACGYKVSDDAQHENVVPDPDEHDDVGDRFLDETRDILMPSRTARKGRDREDDPDDLLGQLSEGPESMFFTGKFLWH